ncbi:hypothetical protein FOPE_11998 [Fonsecaea pedrosoi]|nr:hypothetical protein FOPE_11998 [Fonsecaea pedrosoi]
MRLFRRPSLRSLVLVALVLTLIVTNTRSREAYPYQGQKGPLYDPARFWPGTAKPAGQNYTRVLVTTRLPGEDTSWLDRDLPDLPKKIYSIDATDSDSGSGNGPSATNRGSEEAVAYLTYIIDHYDALPDIVLFFRPAKKSRHNNVVLDADTGVTIKLLSDAHVMRQGYFNARCHLDPGCPDWLHVDQPVRKYDLVRKPAEPALTSALFHDLFGHDTPIPRALSQPCCAQFAVSGERIRQRSVDEYRHYRAWLKRTSDDSSSKFSAAILEYSWQYIFTGLFEFCPSPHRCLCDGYGVCFEGRERGLRRWLESFDAKEGLDAQLLALGTGADGGGRSDSDSDSNTFKDLKNRRGRLGRELDRARELAVRRGFDPRTRARECGRPWRAADGF